MNAITICAANYLPFVNVLGESYLNHNNESQFYVLVVDASKVDFSKNPNFIYITPDDLDIPANVFRNMSFYYDVTELSTALKPSALKYLLSIGSEKVIYLDPDIEVFGSLAEIELLLAEHEIVLTPHTTIPMPKDGLRPTEAEIMASGTFNLGFIGVKKSPMVSRFLNWWEECLKFDSISDPENMLFTDQRWVDLVPSYFDFFTCRSPEYNVAYWNLHERKIEKKNGSYCVNGKELRFFHFSGFRPEKPWILSKYVSDQPRVVVSHNPVLRDLCVNYANQLTNSGYESTSLLSYGFLTFESGKLIPSSLRRLYREDCKEAYSKGEILEPPVNWQTWATSRSIDSGNLSRILFSLWKSRPDLQRRFPDATGKEVQELVNWARTHGVAEKVIDSDLLEIGNLEHDKFPTKNFGKKGINVAGYLRGELGLGQSARLVLESAKATGLPVSAINSNRTKSRQNEVVEENNEEIFNFTISVVNADHFEFWYRDIKKSKITDSTIIGVWAWETEDFPDNLQAAFDHVDEIWAVSSFVKNAIKQKTNKPIFVFPTPIIPPNNIEALDKDSINLPKNHPYNLFIFDYLSVFNRKNPIGLIEAHKLAFPEGDGPNLVIKSINSDKDCANRERLRYLIDDRKDIYLIEDYMSRAQLTALINECQAYISLHSSEGYGLTLAEAMSLGKPVIATGYSGNLDFMNSNNSILIDYSLEVIGPDSHPYSENSNWAKPDLSQAAKELVKLYTDGEYRNKFANNAMEYIKTACEISKSAEFIQTRLDFHNKLSNKIRKKINRVYKRVITFLNLAKKTAKQASWN